MPLPSRRARLRRIAILAVAGLPVWVLARPAVAASGEALPADQAFRLSAVMELPDRIAVHFQVADGYYLYRDKLRFSAEPAAVGLGAPLLPRGKAVEDEFFGQVEILRGHVQVQLPVRLPPGADRFTLQVLSQGCSDAGLCYTPQRRSLVLGPGLGEVRPTGSDRLMDSLKGR